MQRSFLLLQRDRDLSQKNAFGVLIYCERPHGRTTPTWALPITDFFWADFAARSLLLTFEGTKVPREILQENLALFCRLAGPTRASKWTIS